MRLIPYIILAYLALGLQVGLSEYVMWNGAKPNFVLLAAVFIAINAPRDAALLGCFGLGIVQDLLTAQAPGLHALSYGLLGMMLSNAQSAVYRRHPLTHVTVACLGGVITTVILYVQSAVWSRWIDESTPPAVRLSLANLLLGIVYTAALAPFVIGVLQRIRVAFSFQPPRRGHRM